LKLEEDDRCKKTSQISNQEVHARSTLSKALINTPLDIFRSIISGSVLRDNLSPPVKLEAFIDPKEEEEETQALQGSLASMGFCGGFVGNGSNTCSISISH
jgi:hypothetical protein